ncbi:MAG: YceI family protein, partial [Actinobacteria bacterium]|nr:YceI family protein [Actinomycetota bacterium]
MRRLKWIIALPVAAIILLMAGTWAYINVFSDDAPAPLTLGGTVTDNIPATTTTAGGAATEIPASFDGTWIATSGSQAGYRVNEVLFGQNAEAV